MSSGMAATEAPATEAWRAVVDGKRIGRGMKMMGDRVMVVVAPPKKQEGAILLGRETEQPFGYVVAVGPDCTPGAQHRRAVDKLVAMVRDPEAPRDVIGRQLETVDRLRRADKALQYGDCVFWHRDLSMGVKNWEGTGHEVLMVREAELFGVVDGTAEHRLIAVKTPESV